MAAIPFESRASGKNGMNVIILIDDLVYGAKSERRGALVGLDGAPAAS